LLEDRLAVSNSSDISANHIRLKVDKLPLGRVILSQGSPIIGKMRALEPNVAADLAIEAGRVFTPASPVDEKSMFSGRTEQIRKVVDAVNQKGQHVVIFGERGVGKTSLSNVLSSFLLRPQSPVISPRVNCDATDTFGSLCLKIFREIELSQTIRARGFSPGVTQTPVNAVALLGGDFSPDGIRRALTVLSHHTIPIIIIDEFDRVATCVRTAIADTIKTLSDHAVRTTLVLVGVAENVEQLVHEHRSIERALVQIPMPRMSPDEIEQIFRTGLSRLSMSIEKAGLKRITVLSQGLPHYAHLLGLYASRVALDARSSEILLGDVHLAVNRALDGAQQSIRASYHLALRSPRKDNLFAEVLLSCALAQTDALGEFAAQDVRSPMQAITGKDYGISSFAQHLNEFADVKRGTILRKSGTKRRFRYKFTNPLMQPFVIMRGVSVGRLTDVILDRMTEKSWRFLSDES
jgi:Cdc6-like AAA superfamily ATPase